MKVRWPGAVVLLISVAAPLFSQQFPGEIQLSSPRMHGDGVATVQKRLWEMHFPEVGEADGWYGPLTQGAVAEFQRFTGFPDTGIVDRATWSMLFARDARTTRLFEAIAQAKSASEGPFTKSEDDLGGRSTEGGFLQRFTSDSGSKYLDIGIYGEMGKLEARVIYLPSGFVVLQKDFRYPRTFDLDHAVVANTAFYFLEGDPFKVEEGKLSKASMTELFYRDVVEKESPEKNRPWEKTMPR